MFSQQTKTLISLNILQSQPRRSVKNYNF